MEIEKIRALATLLEEFKLEELKLSQGEDSITLRRPPAGAFAPFAPSQAAQPFAAAEVPAEIGAEEAGVITITSPMVGILYAAPSPSDPPFVSVGQKVKAGDVLCIIEAMKLMNEIVAEQDGLITQCYHGNEQLVEFGQPLFQMRCN